LRPEDLPWDIEAPAPVVTVDFPLIVVPPLPERGQRGNFLLDLITFLWSKLK
jgi:hypothetical protein